MAAQGNPQVPQPNNPQQQRMIRPVMNNNPGLRHLLQQVCYNENGATRF